MSQWYLDVSRFLGVITHVTVRDRAYDLDERWASFDLVVEPSVARKKRMVRAIVDNVGRVMFGFSYTGFRLNATLFLGHTQQRVAVVTVEPQAKGFKVEVF